MSGCYCEFDPGQLIISEPYECACWEPDASQCGYPKHNYCKFDSDHPDEGCEGKQDWKSSLRPRDNQVLKIFKSYIEKVVSS